MASHLEEPAVKKKIEGAAAETKEHNVCKKEKFTRLSVQQSLLHVYKLLEIINKLPHEERDTLVHSLSKQDLELVFTLMANYVCADHDDITDEDFSKFKEDLVNKKFSISSAKSLYRYLSNPEIDFEKRQKRLFRQSGSGFGVLTALIPLLSGLVSSFIK